MVIDGLAGALQVERYLTPEQRRWDASQHQIGIGHGRRCATLVIAGGPGMAPALRARPSDCPTTVTVRTAATSANGVDVGHRDL